MNKTLFGKKVGMSQTWCDNDKMVPITIVKVDTNVINRIKTIEKDGYTAIQIAYGDVSNPQKIKVSHKGQFGDRNPKKHLEEIRTNNTDDYKIGQEFGVDVFEVGEVVDVRGTSKGKGFAGTMKRHNFSGVNASHGEHLNHRKPGSIGACATPGRVFMGKRMAGRMGGDTVTIQNLIINSVDKENNLLNIQGAIPGSKNSIIRIKTAVKG
jgi:large subunit ribosomal protein L3